MTDTASPGFRHDTPKELQSILGANEALATRWHALTDLGRNEWICWMTSPIKQATRDARLVRLQDEVLAGKRRPCCWPGCPHRRASAGKYFKA